MKVMLLGSMIVCISWASNTRPPETPKKLSCNCGWRNMGRIVGGKETAKNEYPWMVWLSNECGGSIITQYHVLTAAHCTNGIHPSSLVVYVGKHYKYSQNKGSNLHHVFRIIKHRGYKKNIKKVVDDISVIVLATPITFNKFVGPVCLPEKRFDLEGKFVKITGWGSTEGTGDDNVLREVDVKVISTGFCNHKWGDINKKTQICSYTPKHDACNGDSGGPLVYLDTNTNRYTQVALVSYGDPDCVSTGFPSVNTDVYSYISWIKKATQSHPKGNFCTKIIKRKKYHVLHKIKSFID